METIRYCITRKLRGEKNGMRNKFRERRKRTKEIDREKTTIRRKRRKDHTKPRKLFVLMERSRDDELDEMIQRIV
jgi:hypothetical protein